MTSSTSPEQTRQRGRDDDRLDSRCTSTTQSGPRKRGFRFPDFPYLYEETLFIIRRIVEYTKPPSETRPKLWQKSNSLIVYE